MGGLPSGHIPTPHTPLTTQAEGVEKSVKSEKLLSHFLFIKKLSPPAEAIDSRAAIVIVSEVDGRRRFWSQPNN